jgi:hypothetical protein
LGEIETQVPLMVKMAEGAALLRPTPLREQNRAFITDF